MLAVVSLIVALVPAIEPRTALAFNPQLRRYPYLTDVVESSATINWATDQSSTVGVIRWGRVGVESCTANVASATRNTITVNQMLEYQWKATLALAPDTQYCYRVYLGSNSEVDLLGTDPSPRFWTQIPAGANKPLSFAVFGDWGAVDDNGTNEHQANLMQQIAQSGARFALTTGDNGYPSGSQTNYGDLVQIGKNTSGVFGPKFWTVAGASIALFPAVGNHGLGSSSANHPHVLNWPQDTAVAGSGGRYTTATYCCLNGTYSASYVRAWYAFGAGNARFYMLQAAWSESNLGTANVYANDYAYHWAPNSPQYQWLERDLATHSSALKFAFFHYPLYSDSATESSNTFLQGLNSLEGLLSSYGVSIVFNGHGHIYQRNVKPHANSVVSYITGGGGAKLTPVGGLGCSAVDAYAIGWSFSANDGLGVGSACGNAPKPTSPAQVFHYLLVAVDGTRVTVTPIDSLGQAFDVQTYRFDNTDTKAPAAPKNLVATDVSATRVVLSWKAATDNVGVTRYTIYRNNKAIWKVEGTALSFLDANVAPQTSYTYSIAAFDAANNRSPLSNSVSVKTPKLDDRKRNLMPIVIK